MEKIKPTTPLANVKKLVEAGKIRYTHTAVATANALGFRRADIRHEIMALEPREFYKSMTTYADSHIWQDVYHHEAGQEMLYVKVTVADDVLVVSFKAL